MPSGGEIKAFIYYSSKSTLPNHSSKLIVLFATLFCFSMDININKECQTKKNNLEEFTWMSCK